MRFFKVIQFVIWTGFIPLLFLPAQEVRTTENFQSSISLPYSEESQNLTLDLADYFTIEGLGNGTLVRFTSNFGVFHIELLDEDAPITTENFLNYIESGRYTNSIIHRSVSNNPNFPNQSDFVLQGGGFFLTEETLIPQPIETDAPIVNEFNPKNSNVRGTLSMAKIGGDPDSATSQFFINLSDNSSNLDNQNGGFTVFAKVVGNGMTVVDQWADIRAWNAAESFNNGAFTEIPLPNFDNTGSLTFENYLQFPFVGEVEKYDTEEAIGLIQLELSSLSNETLANINLDGTELNISVPPLASGATDINLIAYEAGLQQSNIIAPTLSLSVGGLVADEDLSNNWFLSNWFGQYNESELPWIYHRRLGWLYRDPDIRQGGVALYTPLGWLWTRQDLFPYFWKFASGGESGNWLYWAETTSDPAYFFDFAASNGAGAWVTFE